MLAKEIQKGLCYSGIVLLKESKCGVLLQKKLTLVPLSNQIYYNLERFPVYHRKTVNHSHSYSQVQPI